MGSTTPTAAACAHDDLIGKPEGSLVVSPVGTPYLALRPRLADYVLSMPRGAQVIYPKDAAQILMWGDVFPGARVLEAGAGSGALTCSLLQAVGPAGQRACPTRCAPTTPSTPSATCGQFFGEHAAQLDLAGRRPRRLTTAPPSRSTGSCWTCWRRGSSWTPSPQALVPGGVLVGYVATTTQLSRLVEDLREQQCWTEPQAWETPGQAVARGRAGGPARTTGCRVTPRSW